ncbi:MAG: GNAT family N-acetyltransferase [Alphaproteobacteria bacterium]|nr:GNAT family N-acetyltransferase [Alphaproteobacteria bacterium]
MEISIGNFADSRVKALLEYHLRGMHENSPPGHVFALDWSSLQKPEITFWTGYAAADLVVMGALKALGDGAGEIKSMRVGQGQAGKGYGAAMLTHIIAEAKARNYRRLSLETGSTPAFEPAINLYRSFGFEEGEAFAGYAKTEFNRMFHLRLSKS